MVSFSISLSTPLFHFLMGWSQEAYQLKWVQVDLFDRLATKARKYNRLPTKQGRKLPASDKKIDWGLPTTDKGRKL